jgi:anaerobic magnesium-protoporphyrin IX monomethyl ester cyclase
MSRLVLVNPNSRNPSPFASIEPPLWLGLIAGYYQEFYNVSVVDAEADNLTVEQTVLKVGELKPDLTIIVVMGTNPSASSTPKMVVTEELLKLIPSAKITGLHPIAVNHTKCINKIIDGTPNVPWDLFDLNKYKAHNWHCLDGSPRSPYGVIYTSLNCPFKCSYCNIHTLYGDRELKFRPMYDTLEDIGNMAIKGVKNLKIWDELFCLDAHRVETICDFIISSKYDFNIWAYARTDTVTPKMLSNMKRAGINWLAYGFESSTDKKSIEAQEAIKMTKDAGINIMGNFMFGLPGETVDDMKRTLDMAIKNNFEYVNFYVALPYPGSEWYENLKDKPTDWSRFSQFSPNIYANPEVVKFRDEAFKTYFNRPEYLTMIRKEFGIKAENHIKELVKWQIR